jgi:hypothetical protein
MTARHRSTAVRGRSESVSVVWPAVRGHSESESVVWPAVRGHSESEPSR